MKERKQVARLEKASTASYWLLLAQIYAAKCMYVRMYIQGVYKAFYPSVWADQRIWQEFKSVIAGWIVIHPVVRVDN